MTASQVKTTLFTVWPWNTYWFANECCGPTSIDLKPNGHGTHIGLQAGLASIQIGIRIELKLNQNGWNWNWN